MFRYLGEAHPEEEIVFTQPLQGGENLGGPRIAPSLSAWLGDLGNRRYSILPLKFECECPLTQNAFWGSETARHLRALHAAGSNLAVSSVQLRARAQAPS